MHPMNKYRSIADCACQIWRGSEIRIPILVSGSAAFVVLGTRDICGFTVEILTNCA